MTKVNKQQLVMEKAGYLPTTRAAALLQTSVYTIYRWIKDGKIVGEKIGSHWYVKRDALKATMTPAAWVELEINLARMDAERRVAE